MGGGEDISVLAGLPPATHRLPPLPPASPMQHNQRLAQFKATLQNVVHVNTENNTWWAAPNEFSDLSFAEFSKRNLGTLPNKPAAGAVEILRPTGHRKLMSLQAPYILALDWKAQNKTTPIKNQGSVSREPASSAAPPARPPALPAAWPAGCRCTLHQTPCQIKGRIALPC